MIVVLSSRRKWQKPDHSQPKNLHRNLLGPSIQCKTDRDNINALESSGAGTMLVHRDQAQALGVGKGTHLTTSTPGKLPPIGFLEVKPLRDSHTRQGPFKHLLSKCEVGPGRTPFGCEASCPLVTT